MKLISSKLKDCLRQALLEIEKLSRWLREEAYCWDRSSTDLVRVVLIVAMLFCSVIVCRTVPRP